MESKSTLNKVLTPEKSEIVKAAENAKVHAAESAEENLTKVIKRNNELRIKVADILKNCADRVTLDYFAKSIEKINKNTHAEQ